jgi:hypothetical protein
MSENRKGHLDYILNRWIDILKHLNMMNEGYSGAEAIHQRTRCPFAERYKGQIAAIHITAYYLTPDDHKIPLNPM